MRRDILDNFAQFSGRDFDIPALPSVALRVMQIVSNNSSSIDELKNVISSDPSFTSRLLRIANSPYYQRSSSISTVDEAIMLIGSNMVKSLVVCAALKDLQNSSSIVAQLLWEHSIGVSLAATIICQETGLLEPDDPLVHALLHDIGKVVLHSTFAEQYAETVKTVKEQNLSFAAVEQMQFGFTHCEVGAYVACSWNLPEHVSFVLEHHHTESALGVADRRLRQLLLVIKAADALCAQTNIGLGGINTLSNEEWKILRLSDVGKRQAISSQMSSRYPVYKEFLMG